MELKLLVENQVCEAYIHHIFGAGETGPVKITRHEDVGRYIMSLVSYSDYPAKPNIGITLVVPNSPNEPLKRRHGYFTIEDQSKINDFIYKDYKIWVSTAMSVATGELRLTKTEAITCIMDLLNLQDDPTLFENLKKNDYRRRKKVQNFLLYSINRFNK